MMAAWLQGQVLEAKTASTIIEPSVLLAELHATRSRDSGIDDEENEPGTSCIAVPVFHDSSDVPAGAISVSALRFRYPIERLLDTAPA